MKTADAIAVTIDCPTEIAGYLSEILWALSGVQSVEQVFSGPINGQSVTAVRLFADADETVARLQELLTSDELLNSAPCRVQETHEVRPEDWAESWKRFWHVTRVSPNCVIRPTWEEYVPVSVEEIVIDLDPGCAFGTGTHETTCLMLREMEGMAREKPFAQRSILDVGCGSGVLSIYAAKLGCGDVMALDISADAVRMTEENARLNRVGHCVEARTTQLIDMCQTRYDLILANIVAPVLLELMDEMCVRLEDGGELVLSGLIDTSVAEVQAAMDAAGFVDIHRKQDADWYLLRGTYLEGGLS